MTLQCTDGTSIMCILLLTLQVKAALPFAALVAEPAVARTAIRLWVQASAAASTTAANGAVSAGSAEQCVAVQSLAQQIVLALLQQCDTDMRRLVVQCLARAAASDSTEQPTDSSVDDAAVRQQRDAALLHGLALPLSGTARPDYCTTSSNRGSADSEVNQLLRELLLHCSEDSACAVTRSSVRAVVCSVCAAVTASIASTQQQQQQQQQCVAAALLSSMRQFEPLLQAAAWRWRTIDLHGDDVCNTNTDDNR